MTSAESLTWNTLKEQTSEIKKIKQDLQLSPSTGLGVVFGEMSPCGYTGYRKAFRKDRLQSEKQTIFFSLFLMS